jgi:cellulose synthase/poly-beta-1,6-N-acetylglucosamine synthase-like glycosyltransferase
MNPTVSVIIPCYNDGDRLQKCLQALRCQNYDNYQVIVCDNNSTENIYSVCKDFNVTYCHEEKPGNNAARNTAIRQSQGEILAITDSDTIPHPDWIKQGVKALYRSDAIGMVGGEIRFFFQTDKPNIAEYADYISYLRQQDYIEQEHYAAGANLFIRWAAFEQSGGFDERLLNLGDKEFCQRTWALGWQIVYAPLAIVHHPARPNMRSLLAKTVRQTRANWRLAQLRQEPIRLYLYHFLPLGWRFYWAVWRDRNLSSPLHKIRFTWVLHRLKGAIAGELLRLLMKRGMTA